MRLLLLTIGLTAVSAAQVTGKRPITHQDYDSWRSIQNPQLSPNGKFAAYGVFPEEGSGEVVVRNLSSGREMRESAGTPPPPAPGPRENPEAEAERRGITFTFSPDSRYLAFLSFAARAERDMPGGLVVIDLDAATATRIENVRSFQLPARGAGWIAYSRGPARPAADAARPNAAPQTQRTAATAARTRRAAEFGSELVVRNLSDGSERVIPDVLEFSFARDAGTIVYAVASRQDSGNNGVYTLALGAQSQPNALAAGKGHYRSLTWDRNRSQLVFLSDRDDASARSPKWKIYRWDGKGAAEPLISTETAGFPQGLALSDRAPMSFSRDGARIFFSAAPPDAAGRETADAPTENRVTLDLWHYLDDFIQPMQKVRAERDRNRSYRAAYHFEEKKLVALADPAMADVNLSEDGNWAIGIDDREYRRMVEYDQRYADVYLVRTITGERKLLAKKNRGTVTWAPGSRHGVFFDGRDWNSISVSDGRIVKLTDKLNVAFWNETDDRPGVDPPYGMGGFTSDGKWVLLYDRYDVWQVSLENGTAKSLTAGIGRKEKIEFRYARGERRGAGGGGRAEATTASEAGQERGIDPARPVLIRAEHEITHDSGFYRNAINSNNPPERLVMAAKYFSAPVKARDAEVYLLTASTFSEFPDLLVSDASFREMRKISDANPQKAGLLWGTAELISYKSTDGAPLQGVLLKPENFDAAKKYPMIVYLYERLSGRLHRFVNPAPGTSINATYYASNGYLVLMPDIVYTVGYPGPSALKCVLPAIQAVVDRGMVDEKAIGIQGHSWGGYEIAYMITQTSRFRAAAAGAPVANMISAYNGIRWGPGLPRQFQYERTQSRIGGTIWEYPTRFLLNSPVLQADRVTTPLMILHNDADDAVPWYQGIELYLSLRRLGKEVYLFNYNGEPHGIRRRPNQKDYTVRMQQFFDYYLKDKKKPEWMERGVPFLERDAEKQRLQGVTDGGPAN